ncbi:ATP-binding cassette domain-containing protein [Mesorhizobium sp. KR1-2]|uniref:ABC transporter ATP-binding protein n=1 Tax=Mesorhizobium sp. KR1-2 TaxID=3156609 RepID=UPI0032B596EE
MNRVARSTEFYDPRTAKPIAFEQLGILAANAAKGQVWHATAATGLGEKCLSVLKAIMSTVAAADEDSLVSAAMKLRGAVEARGAQILSPGFDDGADSSLLRPNEVTLELPPGDKPFVHDERGIRLSVGPGERTRLWLKSANGEPYWVHMLLKLDFAASDEPVAAFRFLHHNDDEEVVLRFRRSGIVLRKEVELPMPASRSMFFSVAVVGGSVRVFLNGVPVYCRSAPHPVATGFILDVIGIPGGATEVLLPLLAVEPAGDTPLDTPAQDCALLATGLVEAARQSGSRSRLHEALHCLEGCTLAFHDEDICAMIGQARGKPVFSGVLDDLLVARLANEAERRDFIDSRPMPILRVRNVSVTLSSNPGGKTISGLLRRGRRPEELRLLDDLSLDAFAGDIVGILGRNGAGKTTLLKSLVGAIPISAGRIDVESRPVLLRPGAGMQPDLTGRQNIHKTGLYMGMTVPEIEAIMDEVIGFAELEKHIDRPFKYYSDGMRARLIFSMATAMPHAILLLDELLSAGDLGFQERAMDRLHRFLSRAKLVLVVQHTFDFVLTRCTKCLLLDKGVPIYFGEPRIAAELYRELL